MTSSPIMTAQTETLSTEQASTTSFFTIEMAIYGAIGFIALILRLTALARYPLNDTEATQALAALDIFRGNIPTGSYSPLMASLGSAAYLLFGASDWTARLASVVMGTMLTLTPFALRKQLGRIGALAAAILLALSASGVFWSRIDSGDIGAALGAMLVLVGGVRWLSENRIGGLSSIAIGLALLILSGGSGFTALTISLILLAFFIATDKNTLTTLQNKLSEKPEILRRTAWIFAGAILILATAATFNLGGIAAMSEQFNGWLHNFGFQARAGGMLPAILSVAFYDPLIIVFGLAGIFNLTAKPKPILWILAGWATLAIVLDLLQAGRSGGQVLLIILPLALLAGERIDALWHLFRKGIRVESDGMYIAIGLMVSIFVYISATSWARCVPSQAGCNTAWVLPLAGLVIIFGLAALFWNWYGFETAVRDLGSVSLVVLAVISLGLMWRLNFGLLRNLPFQSMVQLPASTHFVDLMHDIHRQSNERVGDRNEIDISVLNFDTPMLRWYLKDFPAAHFVADFLSAENSDIILTRATDAPPFDGYVGQEYSLISYWNPSQLQGKDWARWYIYRFVPNYLPGSDQVVMWVKN